MSQPIFSQATASVSQLKKNPMETVAAGDGAPVAILKDNEPVFYCIPADAYAALMERMEDLELNALANQRVNDGQPVITVTLDEL